MQEEKKKQIFEYFLAASLIKKKILKKIEDKFVLDLNELMMDDPEAHDYFLQNPEEIRKNICGSLNLFTSNAVERFKISNFSYLHPISILRVEHIAKLVKVNGMISKTTKVIALTVSKKWECPTCGGVITVVGPQEPRGCTCGRRGGFRHFRTIRADIQEVELEELQENIEDKQPQKIRVRFMYELCDKEISGILQPGNKIEVVGLVEQIEIFKNKKKDEEETSEYRINAYDVNSLEEKYQDNYISEEEEKQILEFKEDKPLEKLANSLAPSIFGHNDIKKAIVLQMAGGVKRLKADGSIVRDRSHILIVGDPGTGKSHIVKCTMQRIPKSYYVSADSSTKAGLIASTEKDELLNEWCVKAGALCKANDSILGIDEVDKASDEDRAGLHTPMESGEVPINKASIHTTLKANCSILAAGNPKEGMFDLENPDRTITKQIDLPPALLSRFDLIFVMTDKIDEENDSSIVDSIYLGKKSESTVSIDFFRKYITYVRRWVPKRRDELLDNIKKFYNKVRGQSISKDSTMKGMPITPRHLEGILRLAEANAKIRLSEYVEEEDLKVAQDLFMGSLLKLGMDEDTGLVDMAKATGEGKTRTKKIKYRIIITCIKNSENEYGRFVPYNIVKKLAAEQEIKDYEFEELLNDLKSMGELLFPRSGYIQLI